MNALALSSGLMPRFPSPPLGGEGLDEVVTEEAAVLAPDGRTVRVDVTVREDEVVAEGAPVAALRDAPGIRLVAPMPGRVARISLLPGRRLSEIVLFRETAGDAVRHDVGSADTAGGLRDLMQRAGFWPWIRRRPFGGMPAADETPAAILVMAADTRPLAPDPRRAIEGREDAFARGVLALTRLTDGPVFVCRERGGSPVGNGLGHDRVREVICGPRHPQGSAGIRISQLFPVAVDAPVWDLHAEDVALLGEFLETGVLSALRHVHIGGPALRESRLVRTQAGADMRALTRRFVKPGPHVLVSGSPIDGHEAQWLDPRHRQVTALPRDREAGRPHWLVAALTRSARPMPVIPSAALTQAFGHAVPAVPFVRALSSGDDETAIRLGLLALLEEDLALADYVLGGEADLAGLLRGMLERVRTEFAA